MRSIVYFNGVWMPRYDYIDDLGLWRANSVLEVLEARQSQMFHWDYHHERLMLSCKDYGIPATQPALPSFEDILKHATTLLNSSSEASIVWMLISKGVSKDLKTPDGKPIFTLKVTPFWPRNPKPFNLVTMNISRELPSIKLSGGYGYAMYYKNKAIDEGFDSFLYRSNSFGITEGAFENIFFVTDDDVLVAPKLNLMQGITRRVVLELAKNSKIFKDVVEKPFYDWQLSYAKEAFLTSTTLGIAEIGSITSNEKHEFKTSPENTYTLALKEKFLNYREEYFSKRGMT